VDIGTNSVRVLIAEVVIEGGKPLLRTLSRLMTITRLGQGVDRQGFLSLAAIDRTARVLRHYRELIDHEKVDTWEIVATSAARDARNAADFMEMTGAIMDKEPRLISGDEEARLSFLGATYDLAELRPQDRPVAVVDIGGGSTEVIIGEGERILQSSSLDIGCVRMSERFLSSDPPLPRELEEMEAYIKSVLAPSQKRISGYRPGLTVGTAGTITTLCGMKQGLQRYDGEAIHHAWLTRKDVEELYERLFSLTLEDRRSLMRLEPGRADVIVGGTGVLLVLSRELGWQELLVSEKDILDGLTIDAAQKGL
jgi:exopolyphosphatase/guanosine-5'-triphosphate,3'-diphosphate pyrophosphatase